MINHTVYCNQCVIQPNTHSFELLCKAYNKETDECVSVYYTKVANAINYNDTEGILRHYENLLTYSFPDSWIWIFDCNGFGFKHSIEIKTAIGIAKLLNKYGRLIKILVINSNSFINIIKKGVDFVLDNEICKNTIMIHSDEKTKYLLELTKYYYDTSDDFNKLSSFMKS